MDENRRVNTCLPLIGGTLEQGKGFAQKGIVDRTYFGIFLLVKVITSKERKIFRTFNNCSPLGRIETSSRMAILGIDVSVDGSKKGLL